MSWQAYADSIIATRHANYSVIASCEQIGGYGVWAVAGNIQPTPQEIEVLVKRFETPNNGEKLIIGGKKFMATSCNSDFLTGRDNANGIAVAKSNKVLVVGLSGEGQNQGTCLDKVIQIVNGLKAGNY